MFLTINGIYADQYIKGVQSLVDKINKIDLIIAGLEDAEINGILNSDKTEYFYDNSQSKIIVKYRNPNDIAMAIDKFEAIKQRYVNRINGRMTQLIDVKSVQQRWGS